LYTFLNDTVGFTTETLNLLSTANAESAQVEI
jgi:hypothetical protein